MGSLRDEQEEKQKLEKNNFDLKMKVYYLEESLKRFQDGEHMTDAQSDHQKIEISKLKLQLEDKQIDLEQRNLLLIKSKNAIEALKTEIERLRNENDHHQDLEDRIRRLKQLNDELEQDYRTQISQLEQQLSTARQQIDSREIEKSSAEDKVVNLHFAVSFVVVFVLTCHCAPNCAVHLIFMQRIRTLMNTEPLGDILRANRQPPEGHPAREATAARPAARSAAEDPGAGGGRHAA